MYQALAPGGVINQIVVPEPIRALPRPVDIRPRRNAALIPRSGFTDKVVDGLPEGPVQIVANDGWGKTSIVAQLAYEASIESHRDGVAVISAWGLPAEDVEQAIFDAFYESTLPDTVMKATPGQLRTSLSDVVAAIVVDDLDVPRQHVDRIIDACPGCGFISTASTQTMWSGGTVLDVDHLETHDALALFEERLGRIIETGERDAVTRFISGVAGYPMAIVAGASAVKRGATLIEALPLIAGAGDPIAAVHEQIAETLTLAESRLLSVLASVGGAPLPSEALTVTAQVDEAETHLEALKQDGIIQAASPTYRLPSDTASLLDLPDALSATVNGLSRWCQDERRIDKVAAAGPAIAEAIRSASQHGDPATAMRLGRYADGALSLSGRWGVWSDVLEQVASTSSKTNDRFVRGWSLHQLGTRSLATGASHEAENMLNEAADIRRQIGDTSGLEVTEHNIGFLTPSTPAVTWETKPLPKAASSGIPGWFWAIVVVGIIAAVGVLIFNELREDPGTPTVVTTIATPGDLESSTGAIEFPELVPGSSATAEIELGNTGPGALEVRDVSMSGDEPFELASECGSLGPAESCLVEITFAPDQPGEASARIFVEHSGGNATLEIPVFGVAIVPPEAFLTVDPVNVDFGLVPQGEAPVIVRASSPNEWLRVLEVVNAGNVPVQVHDIRLDSDRFIQNNDCASLDPGDTCLVEVRFLAVEQGAFEGRLLIEHSADNPTLEIPLTGVVPEPPNLTIEIVDFSEVVDVFIVDQSLRQLALWVVPVTAAITNAGQQATADDFAYRFEVRNTTDDVIPWIPAVSFAESLFGEFPFNGSIGPRETILVEVLLGFPTDVYGPDSLASIRAEVDSCLGEESIPAPPCRIAESNEEDNMSREFDLKIVVPERIDTRVTTPDTGQIEG